MTRCRMLTGAAAVLASGAAASAVLAAAPVPMWTQGQAKASVVLPAGDEPAAALVKTTLARFLGGFYGIELPLAKDAGKAGTYLVLGTVETNPLLARLVKGGLELHAADLGDEGFELRSVEANGARFVAIHGKTPRALKFGLQELIFYHLPATKAGGDLEWPLNVQMKPELAYRGIYMLPCWSAYDSLDSWKRVLRFNSELTLNRNWFWLDGFPVAGHPASAHGTDYHFERTVLASDENVQSLIDLVNSEDMKFYIGGGWLSWHHFEVVGQDREKARKYYFDYLRAFKGVSGFYFEPTGEGTERADWLPGDSLRKMINDLLERNPDFEVAVAIGRFNNAEYLKLMSELDPKRAYWWWCWGDPHADKALDLYPSVLGWHTTVRMSDIHGTVAAPSAAELKLAGMSTSYDPGMGYGNPWNGWAKMGVYEPRNFDPYTMPYFSHEYRFRERCWNTKISDEQFAQRLGARLFDADMPKGAITTYLALADACFNPPSASDALLSEAQSLLDKHAKSGTARNQDTLARMAEAVDGLKRIKAAAKAEK